jgi:uncharacterized protein
MEIKFSNLSKEQTKELLPDGEVILLGYRGSISHDMFRPSNDPNSIDDKDVMGVFIPKVEYYLGMKTPKNHDRFIGEWDVVNYEFKKFVSLLLKNNPNVLSMLWLAPNHYIHKTEEGDELIANRDIFVSKEAYHSFTGYAYGQLKRMTALNQEALEKINQRKEALVAEGASFVDGVPTLPAGAEKPLVELLRQYEELRSKYFSGYMGDKRKSLVEKHGYDAKNAAHLIRLLRMGIEFLVDGELRVSREDKQELWDIKDGKWSLEKVQSEAEKLFELSRVAYVRSTLPAKPNYDAAEKLCVKLLSKRLFNVNI